MLLDGTASRDEFDDPSAARPLAYAWEHWTRVQKMANPAGYLYRVAQSKARARKEGFLPWPSDAAMPDYEPGLAPALEQLSPSWIRKGDEDRVIHVQPNSCTSRPPLSI